MVGVAVLIGLVRPGIVEVIGPGVERVVIAMFEVGLVIAQVGAAVPVGGEQDLVVLAGIGGDWEGPGLEES